MIERGDLVLRPWERSDAAAIIGAYSDPVIQRWHGRSVVNEAEALEWMAVRAKGWSEETAADWAVTRGGAVVGRAALMRMRLQDGLAEIGYWVVPEARRGGVATAAVGAVTGWAFEDVGLHRIELMHSVQNEASCRVAAVCGFALEGIKRKETLHSDGWHDMHMHALLRPDGR